MSNIAARWPRLMLLVIPIRDYFRRQATGEPWQAFIHSPWRISVCLVYPILVLFGSFFRGSLPPGAEDLYTTIFGGDLPFFARIPLVVWNLLWSLIFGYLIATFDFSDDAMHRYLTMIQLPIFALSLLIPVGLSIGLVSIIDVALAVPTVPAMALANGGDGYGAGRAYLQGSLVPMVRGRVFWDAVKGQLVLGSARGLPMAVNRAALAVAEGDHARAFEILARVVEIMPRGETELCQRAEEVKVMAILLRGGCDTEARRAASRVMNPAQDVRRALLASWLRATSGDTSATSYILHGLPPGGSPWSGLTHLEKMPRRWAEDLRRLVPEKDTEIAAALARWENAAPGGGPP